MSTSSADAPQRRSTRRTVLRTGAHAAWAIPAVQVVSAVTEYAAASIGSMPLTAKLGVTVVSATQSDATLTLIVSVTTADAGATGVSLTVSGSGTIREPVVVPDLVAGASGVPQTISVTLKEKGDGVVSVMATGTTKSDAAPTATSATAVAYAKATVSISSHTSSFATKSGTVTFTVSSLYADAVVSWKATATPEPDAGPTPGTVTTSGGAAQVTTSPFTWGNNGNKKTYTLQLTGATTANGGHLPAVLGTAAGSGSFA